MGQQMGMFDITDPSKCNRPMPEHQGSTPVQFLAMGAAMCCKSKEIDQTVCQVDKCVAGMTKCFMMHNDFDDAAKKITNPKGMKKDDDGKLEGDCAVAITNRVEGALCCTAGMRQLTTTCVPKELGEGDHRQCKDSWNKMFDDPTFYDQAEAIIAAFQPGGYCDGFNANPTTRPKQSGTKMINGKPCAVADIVILGNGCVKGSPHYDNEADVCGNDGKANEAYCSYEVGHTACAYCKLSMCSKCGIVKESGKLSCCAPGGAWAKNCGNDGDSKFDHTWKQGILACERKPASN